MNDCEVHLIQDAQKGIKKKTQQVRKQEREPNGYKKENKECYET